jgi:hypothetical protein
MESPLFNADRSCRVTWIFEKAMFMDMYAWVEQAHDRPFWEIFFETQPFTFEITMLNMHIHSRKMESTDELFTKYKSLETERELIRYGVCKCLSFKIH